MDPITMSALAVAIATGISTVAGKLIDKGVDAALEPATTKVKTALQTKYRQAESQQELVDAFDAALDDTARTSRATDAQKYQLRIRLLEIARPGKEALRDEVMRLVMLASNPNEVGFITPALLRALDLTDEQKPFLSRALFYLREHLYALDEFHDLFNLAHQENVENALRILIAEQSAIERNTSKVASTVTKTDEGNALLVKQAADTWDREPYLLYVANECNRLRLSIIDPQYVKPSGEGRIALLDVYTDLKTTTTLWENRDGKRVLAGPPNSLEALKPGKDFSELSEHDLEVFANTAFESRELADLGWKRIDLTALEVISQPNARCVVLLGDPGGGKSTFTNYLALCLTKAQLVPQDNWMTRLNGWTKGALLPVRVVLRDLGAWVDKERKTVPNGKMVADYIRYAVDEHLDDEGAHVVEHLKKQGGLVLFDGLDEVPDTLSRRGFVRDAIQDFARSYAMCL